MLSREMTHRSERGDATATRRQTEVEHALAGQYDILHVLGEGGMSTVYLAKRAADGMEVAIKVLKREFAVSVLSDRFHQEIEFLTSLEHPNILPLLPSEHSSDILFYVMPYARAGSLGQKLQQHGRFDLDDVVAIASDVAEALDYAHARDIVHRDIKPGNILFIGDHATICDFGVARALVRAGGERLSSSGFIVGTPAYMSPEQASGYDVDGRADTYSLACVVYEMLTSEPPFSGRTPQVILARQMRERPPSLRILRPDLPAAVERAVDYALAKDPNDRPGSASRFVRALQGS